MILAPASNCMMRPDVTIGEMPSSINVPFTDKTMIQLIINNIQQMAKLKSYKVSMLGQTDMASDWALTFKRMPTIR